MTAVEKSGRLAGIVSLKVTAAGKGIRRRELQEENSRFRGCNSESAGAKCSENKWNGE